MIEFLPGIFEKIDSNFKADVEDTNGCICVNNFHCHKSYLGLQGYADGINFASEHAEP